MIGIGTVFYNNTESDVTHFAQSYVAAISNSGQNCRLYTIDNGTLETLAHLRKFELGQETKLESRGNIGFGSAMNVLMHQAFEQDGCDVFVTANPDGAFHHDTLRALSSMYRLYPDALIEALQFPEEHPKVFDEVTFQTPWASGCCLQIPRIVYEKTGGFDEHFFMYCEDIDLSWRARCAGFLVLSCPFALYYHHIMGREETLESNEQALVSGRYLGHKWGSKGFQKFCEDKLMRHHAYKELPMLPNLGEIDKCLVGKHKVAFFDRLFSFANTRW